MRHPFTALTLILATVTAVTLVPEFARTQGKSDLGPASAVEATIDLWSGSYKNK